MATAKAESLAEALAKFQQYLESPRKTKANPFFKSKYAGLDDDRAAIQKVQQDHPELGISFVQSLGTTEDGLPTVSTTIYHSSGDKIETGTLALPVGKKDAQGYGSAYTYGRRYSLEAAFGIASEDDDGNTAVGRNAPAQHRTQSHHQPVKKSSTSATGQEVVAIKRLIQEQAKASGKKPNELAETWIGWANGKLGGQATSIETLSPDVARRLQAAIETTVSKLTSEAGGESA